MKKLVILSFLIQASIICSNKTYLEPNFELNVESINKDGSLKPEILENAYNKNIFYEGTNKQNTFVDRARMKSTLQDFFNFGKTYNETELTALKEKHTQLTTLNQNLVTNKIELEKNLNDLNKQSLIKFLNSYSTPAKIGFGIAGFIVIASLVYSDRQLYLFSKQKYSDWKAKKEDESLT